LSIIIIVERVAANTRVITMFPIKAAFQDDCPWIKWPFPFFYLSFWCRSPYSANNIENTVLKISEFVILRVEEMHKIQHTILGNPYLLICGCIWKHILIMSYMYICRLRVEWCGFREPFTLPVEADWHFILCYCVAGKVCLFCHAMLDYHIIYEMQLFWCLND